MSIEQWHSGPLAMVVSQPTATLCEKASLLGVPLIVALIGCRQAPGELLRRLGRWPAVLLALLAADNDKASQWRLAAPNVLLVAHLGQRACRRPPHWADAIVWEMHDNPTDLQQLLAYELPIIVQQRYDENGCTADLKAACQALQQRLAGMGTFAGFIV